MKTPETMDGWRKYCDNSSGNCVETLRREDGTVGIRNSRQPGLVLNFSGDEWHAFLGGLAGGEFRRP